MCTIAWIHVTNEAKWTQRYEILSNGAKMGWVVWPQRYTILMNWAGCSVLASVIGNVNKWSQVGQVFCPQRWDILTSSTLIIFTKCTSICQLQKFIILMYPVPCTVLQFTQCIVPCTVYSISFDSMTSFSTKVFKLPRVKPIIYL